MITEVEGACFGYHAARYIRRKHKPPGECPFCNRTLTGSVEEIAAFRKAIERADATLPVGYGYAVAIKKIFGALP